MGSNTYSGTGENLFWANIKADPMFLMEPGYATEIEPQQIESSPHFLIAINMRYELIF